jgi:hypothetical protein
MSAQKVAPAPYADAPIRIGLPVYTLDNKRLGHVKEVDGDFFKVDARFRKDFWLPSNQVAYVDERCVGMLFRTDESELYKMMRPGEDPLARRMNRRSAVDANDPTLKRHFPLS